MRLKSHLIGIASAAALAFAGANALAQGAPSPQADKEVSKSGQAGGSLSTQPTTKGAGAGAEIGGSTAKSAGANAPSLGPWTADNVTAAAVRRNQYHGRGNHDPVDLDVGRATHARRTGGTQRPVRVITNAQNSSRYMADALQFCRSYMMVAAANPPAGKAPTTTK